MDDAKLIIEMRQAIKGLIDIIESFEEEYDTSVISFDFHQNCKKILAKTQPRTNASSARTKEYHQTQRTKAEMYILEHKDELLKLSYNQISAHMMRDAGIDISLNVAYQIFKKFGIQKETAQMGSNVRRARFFYGV